MGYERFSGMVAAQCMAQLFQAVRWYVNYFQPSFKLKAKTRQGAKVKKVYHKPVTPCDRLLEHASVPEAAKEKLRFERAQLDPLELLHRIRESQSALVALRSGELGRGPGRESLEQFLAQLPKLWREGEARPTHRAEPSQARSWRTGKDPFESVWPEILLWLQADPEATAKSLCELRASVSMREVLQLIGFVPAQACGQQLRGPCPVHGSSSKSSRTFSVNLRTNVYQCFKCGSAGNQLDLYAAVTKRSLFEAAIDLCDKLNRPTPWIDRW